MAVGSERRLATRGTPVNEGHTVHHCVLIPETRHGTQLGVTTDVGRDSHRKRNGPSYGVAERIR
jgi:hypothetical protein